MGFKDIEIKDFYSALESDRRKEQIYGLVSDNGFFDVWKPIQITYKSKVFWVDGIMPFFIKDYDISDFKTPDLFLLREFELNPDN